MIGATPAGCSIKGWPDRFPKGGAPFPFLGGPLRQVVGLSAHFQKATTLKLFITVQTQ